MIGTKSKIFCDTSDIQYLSFETKVGISLSLIENYPPHINFKQIFKDAHCPGQLA